MDYLEDFQQIEEEFEVLENEYNELNKLRDSREIRRINKDFNKALKSYENALMEMCKFNPHNNYFSNSLYYLRQQYPVLKDKPHYKRWSKVLEI